MPASSSCPRVSAVVPTRELNDYGRRCLAALLALGPEIEVIFVPDVRPEGLDPRVVCLPSGPVPVGSKRQLGLEAARGAYVALIDDDALPVGDWPWAAVAELERDPGVAAVAGPSLDPPGEPELERLGGRVYASLLVAGPHRWRYAQVPPRDIDDAPTVNLILRREDALAVRLDSPYYPGDDTIVCDRLIRRGRRLRYVPDAPVLHSRRPLWRGHLRQIWRFGRHRGAFARTLGGNSRRPAYFAPTALVAGLAAGPLLPRPLRRLWRLGSGAYLTAAIVSGYDRSPGRWWRISVGIVATHVAYGVGFALSMLGLRLREDR
jgi:hypothetical protein